MQRESSENIGQASVSNSSVQYRTKQGVQEASRQANPWIERLARLGYVTKGLVYLVIGILATQAAFGAGGQTTDSSGALQEIVTQPFGILLLAIATIGLIGYALWRFIQAAIDPDQVGSDLKGIGIRSGYVVSGLIYAGLAWTAFQMLLGSGGGNEDATRDWTAWLLSQPFGQWLVGLVGVIVIGVGFFQIYKGMTASFREKLDLAAMSAREESWSTRIGQFGLAARGVVIGMVGFFLIQAAYRANPDEARGLGSALRELAQTPFGPWLLAIVALGLIAYGIFMAVMGRYRRITLS